MRHDETNVTCESKGGGRKWPGRETVSNVTSALPTDRQVTARVYIDSKRIQTDRELGPWKRIGGARQRNQTSKGSKARVSVSFELSRTWWKQERRVNSSQ